MTGFSGRRRAGEARSFVETLTALNISGIFTELTAASLAKLDAGPGDAVLDVGSGTGDVLRVLACRVGQNGRLVGVDQDEVMVDAAYERLRDIVPEPELVVADGAALPFDDGTFDRVRSERVLIYSANAGAAVHEMARVVKPVGRVVVAEPDLATSIPDSPDIELTRRILAYSQDMHGSARFGRQARRAFIEAGLVRVTVTAVLAMLTDFTSWRDLFRIPNMLEREVEAGVITAEESVRWLGELEEHGRRGVFLWALTSFVVCGEKLSVS
jgi:SAM-dependent methyltransferase